MAHYPSAPQGHTGRGLEERSTEQESTSVINSINLFTEHRCPEAVFVFVFVCVLFFVHVLDAQLADRGLGTKEDDDEVLNLRQSFLGSLFSEECTSFIYLIVTPKPPRWDRVKRV